MKFHPFAIFALSTFLISCATTHPGNEGKSLSDSPTMPLKISAKTIEGQSSKAFQLVEVTLENTSDDWLRIHHSEVLINNPAESKISVVLGQDLKVWAEATMAKEKQEAHNDDMVKAGILVAGTTAAILGAGKGDRGLTEAGAAVVVGTYTWAAADVINASLKEAQGVDKIPETHLYKEVSIPSKMFLRRWVLLNKPSDRILQKLAVQFETVDGTKDTYVIPLL